MLFLQVEAFMNEPKKHRILKKTLKISAFVVGGILVFFLSVFLLLQISRVQQAVAQYVVNGLSRKTNTEVRLGKVQYRLFNTISLQDFFVADLQQDTLLHVNRLDAKFNFFRFFRGQFIFHSLEFNELTANLSIDEHGTTNFQFLIDAFSQPTNRQRGDIEFNIKALKFANSEVKFRNFQRAFNGETQSNIQRIDFNNLHLFDLNTEISFSSLIKDGINFRIKYFKAQEKSGLNITSLQTNVSVTDTQILMPDFELLLPDSRLQISDVSLNFESLDAFNNFAHDVRLAGRLHSSYIKLDNISSIVPQFSEMIAVVMLQTELDGTLANLNIHDIVVQYGETFLISGDVNLSGLPDLKQTFVFGNLTELRLNAHDTEAFVSDMIGEAYYLPEMANRLGLIRYSGNISGFFSNLVIFGSLQTEIGTVSTDISLRFENEFRDVYYSGTLRTNKLDLGKLMLSEKVGNIAFYVRTVGSRHINAPFQGVVDARVSSFWLNGYTYRDIVFNGRYDGAGFNGKMQVNDENINLTFSGLIDITQQLPILDFELTVQETNLYALNIINRLPDAHFSFHGRTNLIGNSLDNFNGFLRFDSIKIVNNDQQLYLDDIVFVSHTDRNYTNFSVQSSFLNGSVSGNFKYSELLVNALQIAQQYLPSLQLKPYGRPLAHSLEIDLTISNTRRIAEILELPYFFGANATIKGSIDEAQNLIDVRANVPIFVFGNQQFNRTNLRLFGETGSLEFTAESNLPANSVIWNIAINTKAQADTLNLDVNWRNQIQATTAGEFRTRTNFSRERGRIIANTMILPSEAIVANTKWNFVACEVQIRQNHIAVDNFRFGNDDRYIFVNGIASRSLQDSLHVELQSIDLNIITELTNLNNFYFGGLATGNTTIFSALHQPVFDAVVRVENFALNHERLGDAYAFASWNQQEQKINAIATVKDQGRIVAHAECSFQVSNRMLDLMIDAERVNLDFLSKYWEPVLTNTSGYASGRLRIFGLPREIRFEGDMKVTEGHLTVGLLGAVYTFEDTIHLTPYGISFPNITLRDINGNPVVLNGELSHNGRFNDFRYNLTAQTSGAQLANLRVGENDLFFGQAFGQANVRISGTQDEVNIQVNASSRHGTRVFIQTGGTSEALEAGFIRFVSHQVVEEEEFPLLVLRPNEQRGTNTNIRLNLQLEVTPAAEISLILDPVSGDMITGRGSGNIRIEYDSGQGDTRMHGTYTIESGHYLFTFQDGLIRKRFDIENGSTIFWTGDPVNAQVNIRAIYSLTASLRDLIQPEVFSQLQNVRTAVPVQCILILTGNLLSPTINFDIFLPASDEGVRQVVRNIINTEEMMTTQVLYLLVFNKFFMPNNQNTIGLGQSEIMSFAASTLSAQLNNLISQFSTSNAFSVGFDMRRVSDIDMEYQIDLTYRPNHRWIFNGNFGYRQNTAALPDFNQYITDIDIEYLLTESGKLRLRFYSHTIDRATQLRTAQNTQGIGISYRESFNTVGEMFRRYGQLFTGNRGRNRNDQEVEEQPNE